MLLVQKLIMSNHATRISVRQAKLLTFVFGALVAANVDAPQLAHAQYSWVNTTTQSGNWNVPGRWTGGTAGTFPNAVDATATFNLPLSSAPSGVYNVQISSTPGQAITVGGITVNNSARVDGNSQDRQ